VRDDFVGAHQQCGEQCFDLRCLRRSCNATCGERAVDHLQRSENSIFDPFCSPGSSQIEVKWKYAGGFEGLLGAQFLDDDYPPSRTDFRSPSTTSPLRERDSRMKLTLSIPANSPSLAVGGGGVIRRQAQPTLGQSSYSAYS
jgi:hypothetical protein